MATTYSDSDRLVLDVVKELHGRGELVHGWPIARRIHERTGSWAGTGHGTLYRSLNNLVKGGLLRRKHEQRNPTSRPRRTYYEPIEPPEAPEGQPHA